MFWEDNCKIGVFSLLNNFLLIEVINLVVILFVFIYFLIIIIWWVFLIEVLIVLKFKGLRDMRFIIFGL